MAKAGTSLVVPALIIGRECPLLGKGWFLLSSMESIKTGAPISAPPLDHFKDAHDGQADGWLTLALQDFRTGRRALLQSAYTTAVKLSGYASSRAAGCAFWSSMPELAEEGGKDSSPLLSRTRAFRSRPEAVLLAGAVTVICWWFRNTVSLFRRFLSHIPESTCLHLFTCVVHNRYCYRGAFLPQKHGKHIYIVSWISSERSEGPRLLWGVQLPLFLAHLPLAAAPLESHH